MRKQVRNTVYGLCILAVTGAMMGCGAFVQGFHRGYNPRNYHYQQQQQRYREQQEYQQRMDFHMMQEQMRRDNPHMR